MRRFLEELRDIFGTEARDREVMERVAEEQLMRLEAMSKDPVRRKYVARIQRGETWRDEQIAFNEDVNAFGTCVHLEPIVRAMRSAGVDLRPSIPLRVSANCTVDQDALARSFDLPPFVRYLEVANKERSILDPDIAMIACGECNSIIDVVLPLQARPDIPLFPS